jgi:signal transduction histidine kinase
MTAFLPKGRITGRAWRMSIEREESRETPIRRLVVLAAVAAAGIAACGAAVALTLSGGHASDRALAAEIQTLIIAAPIAVGMYAWYRDTWARFAKLLVATGFAWSFTTLAQSDSEVLYSAGRVFGWLVEPLIVLLVLAFPSGRLTSQPARRLFGATVLLVSLLYLPTALLVDSYPTPSPFGNCGTECPANAFMVIGSEPGFVSSVIAPVREAAAMVLLVGVVAVLAARIKRGTPLMRITLVPVLTVAILHAAALVASFIVRRAAPDATGTDVLMSIVAFSYGGVALAFLAGLSAWRFYENRTLRRVATNLASHPPALSLRETAELLADSMDPSLRVFHRPPDRPEAWLDVKGRRATIDAIDETHSVTEISAADGHVVAIVHDAALKEMPTFLAVVHSSVLKALEDERLGTELRTSLRELRESRARIIASADKERQRIERNLHDGAQQSLVALRIKLDLVSQLLRENPSRAEQLLGDLTIDIDEALDEVRALARGVYPSMLADRGLSDALRAAALRSPVHTTVDTDGVRRLRPEIEAATYFCCLEAMQNAMKHATGIKTIAVSLAVGDDLRFEVRDDGDGFDESKVVSGAGLASMRDRLAAVCGALTVRTAPGGGTCVSGAIPLNGNGFNENGSQAVMDVSIRARRYLAEAAKDQVLTELEGA